MPEEHAIGFEQTDGRIVNVGGLRRDPVQLDHLKTAGLEIGQGRRPHIITSEIEAGMGLADTIDGRFECVGLEVAAIEEYRTAAMRSDLDELDPLACRGPVVERTPGGSRIGAGQADGTAVAQNQFIERMAAIAGQFGKRFSVIERMRPFGSFG